MPGMLFREANPTPLTGRFSEIFEGELARVGIKNLPATLATDRLLTTIRAFVAAGEPAAVPGFGRFVQAPAPAPLGGEVVSVSYARLLGDPSLGGRWPHSLFDPKDFFEGRWSGLLYPRTLGGPGEGLPRSEPLRHMAPVVPTDHYERKLAESLPFWLSMTVPEDASDSFSLPWLHKMASMVGELAGRTYVVGTHRYERALFFGIFERDKRPVLFREDVPALFARQPVPSPAIPAVPRDFFPVLDALAKTTAGPYHLARRMVHALSAGEVDLDAVASLWYAILDGHFRGMHPVPAPVAILQSALLAWGVNPPLHVAWIVVERAFSRLAREIANLPVANTCLDLSPLGLLLRVDEPECALSLRGGPGTVTLAQRSNWALAWGGSAGW